MAEAGMKRLGFLAVVLGGIVAFLPSAARGSEGFYGIHAATTYCEGATSCDLFTGPGVQKRAILTVFNQYHAGKRISPPDEVTLFCARAYTDASGVRRLQYNRFNGFNGAVTRGAAGVLTPGDTSASTYARSFVSISVTDPASQTTAYARGRMITNNVTMTLVSGGIEISITGWLENWVEGLGRFGEPAFFPDAPNFLTYGTISCSANTNGIDPDLGNFVAAFPFH